MDAMEVIMEAGEAMNINTDGANRQKLITS